MTNTVALVTGGNRGLGWEVCLQLAAAGVNVILGSRQSAEGVRAVKRLKARGCHGVAACRLDVRSPESIRKAVDFALARFGKIDILVNNAGILPDALPDDATVGSDSILSTTPGKILDGFETNVLGPLLLCQAVIPGMRERDYGRIVNVSSTDGQLCAMTKGRPAYRISKVALNAVTRIFADELLGTNVLVNSVCPGWIKTRMGGPQANRTVAKGAETIVWLALHPDGGPQGGFFRDMKPLPW